jgi:hypothetical protein
VVIQNQSDKNMLEKLGFCFGKRTAHTSRTIMFSELDTLLSHSMPEATKVQYLLSIVELNILNKQTLRSRKLTAERLTELYGLSQDICIFRCMRHLWYADAKSRPLLAFFCSCTRDTLLRLSTEKVVSTSIGATISTSDMENALRTLAPERFSQATLTSAAQNINSSHTQAGYLSGRSNKKRTQTNPTPANVAYALFLGYLEGFQAERLFESFWARLLDIPTEKIHELAIAASRKGWLDYRSAGGIIDVQFPNLLTEEEKRMLYD